MKPIHAEKKMFVVDFDGTLLTDEKIIDSRTLLALESIGRHGIVRVVATGRSSYSFERILETPAFAGIRKTLPIDYVIFSTGAGIMDYPQCRILKSHSLDPEDVIQIAEYFDTQKLDYMVHRSIPDTREFVYRSHGNENPDFHSRIAMYKAFSTPLGHGGLEKFGKATEVLSIVPRQKGIEAAETAKHDLKCYSVIKATSPLDKDSIWIEVFHPSVSKSQAVSWLADQLTIKVEDIASVGNDYNDSDLLAWSGKGFVVENAPESLKDRFEVVASNNQGGVAEAINLWLGLHGSGEGGALRVLPAIIKNTI